MTYYAHLVFWESELEGPIARLLEPPFRVLGYQPGAALVAFGEESLPLLWEVIAALGLPDGLVWDEKRMSYKLTAAGLEPHKRFKPGYNRKLLRRIKRGPKRKAAWAAADKALCDGVTEPAVVPEGRVRWFWRYKRFAAVKPVWKHPFRYSLRSPKGKKTYPLVVYLHSGGSGGSWGIDGVKAVRETALLLPLLFRRCHMLVPQFGLGDPYADEASEALGEAIERLPRVDRTRVYITGTSMGGCGAIIECRRHPGRYTACVTSVAWLQGLENPEKGASKYQCSLDDEAYDALARTPLWLGYGRDERHVNEPLYEALQARGADVKRTYFKGLGHHAAGGLVWLLPWAKWLFSHKNTKI